jgi:hypothetical protein
MTAEPKQVDPLVDQPTDSLASPFPPGDIEQVIREVEAIQGQMQELATQKGDSLPPLSSVAERPQLSVVSAQELPRPLESEAPSLVQEVAPQVAPVSIVPTAPMKEVSLMESQAPAQVSAPTSAKTPTSGVLSMSIQGSMCVQLNFGHKGESMTLDFTDDTVTLQLSNGMELRFPRPRS